MDVLALQEELDEISVVLYQNREQEGIQLVWHLLGEMQTIVDSLLKERIENDLQTYNCISGLFRELYQAFQQKDMLGMADCLQEFALLITEIYKYT